MGSGLGPDGEKGMDWKRLFEEGNGAQNHQHSACPESQETWIGTRPESPVKVTKNSFLENSLCFPDDADLRLNADWPSSSCTLYVYRTLSTTFRFKKCKYLTRKEGCWFGLTHLFSFAFIKKLWFSRQHISNCINHLISLIKSEAVGYEVIELEIYTLIF